MIENPFQTGACLLFACGFMALLLVFAIGALYDRVQTLNKAKDKYRKSLDMDIAREYKRSKQKVNDSYGTIVFILGVFIYLLYNFVKLILTQLS